MPPPMTILHTGGTHGGFGRWVRLGGKIHRAPRARRAGQAEARKDQHLFLCLLREKGITVAAYWKWRQDAVSPKKTKKDDGTVGGQKTEVLQKGEKKQRARRGSIAGIQPAIHIYPRVFHFRAEAGRLAGESHPPGRVRLGAGGMELVDGCAERAFFSELSLWRRRRIGPA